MDEVQRLLHKMNVNLSKRKVKQLFKEADTNTTDDNEGLLDFDEFVCFYKRLSTRPELLSLLQEYSGGKEYLTRQDFELYLRLEQGEKEIKKDVVKQLMERFEPVPENLKEGRLGIDGFTRYLLSEEADLFSVQHRVVNQDMNQPLCHYFIASSHNTYLLGDQVMSHSSVDVYGAVLLSGCRCVEMDCWDGKDGEPIVYHGYTLTTKIKCRDVITVINKHAFVSSPYPVILSIENHCNLQQQKKLANYLIDILGEKLVIQDWDLKRLPSPEALKGKILIKTQKLPLDHDNELEGGEVSEEDSADELEEDFKLEKSGASKFENLVVAQWALKKKSPIKPTHAAWQRIAVKQRKSRSESSESESAEDGNLELCVGKRSSLRRNSSAPPQPWKKKSIILSKQLSDLVKYTRSVAFSGFPADMPCWELPSLGEMRASNLVATRSREFVNFTARNLCRVYPSAYRIDSSNYSPQPMWNCGCQLVALNYQTEGRVMQLARAKFMSNGNCGYVLKPQVMREETCAFEPNLCDPLTNQKKLLTIRIISGQQLPKPPQSLLGERGEIIDPYVEVEVIGLPIDCIKAVTKTVQDNGFNPNWNQTVFCTLHMPEIALIRFAVWDEDPIGRDYIGQATFSVRSLLPGYRHIHLEGLDHATLYIHVMIEDFDEKTLHRLTRARSSNKHDYARTKSVDLDIPVMGYAGGKLSPRRGGNKIPLTQRFNIMRRHTAASIFMVGDSSSSSSASPTKTQNSTTTAAEEDTIHKNNKGEELQSDATPVALDAITTMLEIAEIDIDIAMDGSTKIPLKALSKVFSLNIPVSSIITGVREKKLSLDCGRPLCMDAVEGNIASNRDSVVMTTLEENDETLEEFSFLWQQESDSLQELVAPNRVHHPEHAFVGLENIAEHKSIAGSADDLSSSTDSSDEEDGYLPGPFTLGLRSKVNGCLEESEDSDYDIESDSTNSGTLKRRKTSQDKKKLEQTKVSGHVIKRVKDKEQPFETKVDIFAGDRSRLSMAMEELGADLLGIIGDINPRASSMEPVHEKGCHCDFCLVESCGCSDGQSISNFNRVDGESKDLKRVGDGRAEIFSDENRNWSKIYESKETVIGGDASEDKSDGMVIGGSTDTLQSEDDKPNPSDVHFLTESGALEEPEQYDLPEPQTNTEDVASMQMEEEAEDVEFDRRKEISEKYGVTLRQRSRTKKASIFTMRFKSRDGLDSRTLSGNLDGFGSDGRSNDLRDSLNGSLHHSQTSLGREVKRMSSLEAGGRRGKGDSKYGTLRRWKRFTTGAFLSKSMPDITARASSKDWVESEHDKEFENGGVAASHQEKKSKVFFFWKI
ncbi:uncharacterized protein [Apostichopus japonicus]|uniref:uncharacterized protein isoform X3 n=1 Tax=Stichopus japonicus TaxID=307972 RepID=UPI003AB35037